jgi:hypothetical protein
MGVDFHAYLVAGIRIKRAHLYVPTARSGCEHSIPDGAKFCPECGKPSLVTESVPLDGYNEDDRLHDLDVVPVANSEEGSEVIVGRLIAEANPDTWGGRDPLGSTDVAAIRQAHDEACGGLEQLPPSLAERGVMGIWLVPYVSY